MGKTNSKNADAVKLQADIALLQSQLNETQVKAQEAQNLLRYKVLRSELQICIIEELFFDYICVCR